jgi:hypothetical protein
MGGLEWLVCRIGDMASPQRMGAALTYARRYALVGIAGEDDLDAPDLEPRDPEPGSQTEPNGQSEPRERVVPGHANGSRGRKRPPAPKLLLQPDASAVLRERLLIELAAIATADEAAVWAPRKLPAKNTLRRCRHHRASVSGQAGLVARDWNGRGRLASVRRRSA